MVYDKSLGIFERAQELLLDNSAKNKGWIELHALADYVEELTENEMDAHIGFTGQNGVGKSIANAMFLHKTKNGIQLENLITPRNSYQDFINLLANETESNIWPDEMGHFLGYKEHMTKEQVKLFSAIEEARANRNLISCCARDARRLNNNYRNGKLSVIVQLLERYEYPKKYTEGVVLIGNPYYEAEDKFYLNNVFASVRPSLMRKQFEKLPSFAGYVFFENANKVLPKKFWDEYPIAKKAGIKAATDMYTKDLDTKDRRKKRKEQKELLEEEL